MVRPWVGAIGRRSDPTPRPADRGYMICALPRSGSTYFDQLLSSTGLLGKPREYFNFSARSKLDPSYPADPRQQLHLVLTAGATGNGVYGVKAFPRHLEALGEHVDVFRDLPHLRLVALKRRDRLGQAISLARARQTGHFVAKLRSTAPVVYDQQQIRDCLAHVAMDDRGWDGILGPRSVQPLALDYEDILDDPQRAVDQVAALVGLREPTPIQWSQIRMKIQRDDISEAWRHRFLVETGDEFRHLADPRAM